MGKARALLLPLLVVLIFLMSLSAASSQPIPGGSFDSAGELRLEVGEISQFSGSISQLEEHYYRLSGAAAGHELVMNVSMYAKEGGKVMISLFAENRAKLKTTMADEGFFLRDGETKLIPLRWLTEKGGDFYLKISTIGGNYTYNISATLLDMRDMGKVEAGPSVNEAAYAGLTSYDKELSFFGYLAALGAGDDFVDFYAFETMLRNMEAVRITVLPDAGMSLEASIHLPDGFTVTRNSSASPGKGFTLTLKGDIAGNKTFYLRVHNMDGFGGGGRYSVRISVFNLTVTKPEPEVPINFVDKELARQLVMISVAVIAGITVASLVLRRRTASAEGWYGGYGY